MHRNQKVFLRKAAAVAAAAGSAAALAFAAPSLAHPHADGEEKAIEKIVIVDGKKDGKPGEHVRHFRIHRDGKPGEHAGEVHIKRDGKPGEHLRAFHMGHDGKLAGCTGERTEVDEETGAEGTKEKTRILLCHDDKLSPAERAARLEKTLERIRSDDKLSGEHKARVEAALQTAITRLRASN